MRGLGRRRISDGPRGGGPRSMFVLKTKILQDFDRRCLKLLLVGWRIIIHKGSIFSDFAVKFLQIWCSGILNANCGLFV